MTDSTGQKGSGYTRAFLFCRQLDQDQDINRRAIEREMGDQVRFFPLPCSGRVDPLYLMRALESGADKVYLITCPEGSCRYQEGNLRAKKRVAYTQMLLEEIGLDRERLELITTTAENRMTIDKLVRDIIARETSMGASPVKKK
ncbi:MAG: hydrogenase iron-sulfur subunit [Nitrospirota bacterium]